MDANPLWTQAELAGLPALPEELDNDGDILMGYDL